MTTNRPRALFDLSPLHHPLWWGALALLLLNDNLLKGGGVVPGWLTGKLSDFAFLIVAPVLLAALLPAALPRRRGIALAAVVLVYAAADLSPAVSDAIVTAAHRVGLPWRLWPDVTDLLALVVLPLTWRLMRPARASAPAAPAPRSRPLLESVGVFAGAFACLATSAPDVYAHAPFVVNQTAQPRELTATWLLRAVPCDGDLKAFADSLNPSDLDDPHAATLGSGEVVVLDEPPAPGQPLSRTCPSPDPNRYSSFGYGGGGACVGVVLQAGSELSVLAAYPMRWGESDGDFFACASDAPKTACKPRFGLNESTGPDSLVLRERNGRLEISAGTGSKLRVAVVSPAAIAARTPNPDGCRPLLDSQQQLPGVGGACDGHAACKSVLALPVPGRACYIYGNQSLTSQAASDLRTRWTQRSCLVDPQHSEYGCPPPQPAVCLDGRCQAVCPGVELPVCPSPCPTIDASSGSPICYSSAVCARPDGTWCTCREGKYSCAPPPQAPGCLLTCVPPRGTSGPTIPSHRPDSGTTAADSGTTGDTGPAADTGAD